MPDDQAPAPVYVPKSPGQAVAVILSLLATAFGGGWTAAHLQPSSPVSEAQLDRVADRVVERVSEEISGDLAELGRQVRAADRVAREAQSEAAANRQAIVELRGLIRGLSDALEAGADARGELVDRLDRIATQLERRAP